MIKKETHRHHPPFIFTSEAYKQLCRQTTLPRKGRLTFMDKNEKRRDDSNPIFYTCSVNLYKTYFILVSKKRSNLKQRHKSVSLGYNRYKLWRVLLPSMVSHFYSKTKGTKYVGIFSGNWHKNLWLNFLHIFLADSKSNAEAFLEFQIALAHKFHKISLSCAQRLTSRPKNVAEKKT